MEKKGRKFSKNLKDSKNIALIADSSKGLDSLCASIAIKELIDEFLKKEENFNVSLYYLSNLPPGSDILSEKVKVHNKIGEKTLYITFPAESVKKVTYDFKEKEKMFKLGLLGFKNTVEDKEKIKFEEKEEEFDLVVGIGFDSEQEFKEKIPFVKKFKDTFIFNKKNLKGDTLTEGVIDLYFTENVKPSKLASLAFFTALNYSG